MDALVFLGLGTLAVLVLLFLVGVAIPTAAVVGVLLATGVAAKFAGDRWARR